MASSLPQPASYVNPALEMIAKSETKLICQSTNGILPFGYFVHLHIFQLRMGWPPVAPFTNMV